MVQDKDGWVTTSSPGELEQAIEKILKPAKRLTSDNESFKEGGEPVQPTAVPNGLYTVQIRIKGDNYVLTPSSLVHLEKAIDEKRANAYEIGLLLRDYSSGSIPFQLYNLD